MSEEASSKKVNHTQHRGTLFIIIAITLVGFLVWVGGLAFLWFILGLLGLRTNLWGMIEALSTALAAAAVFTAGFVAYRELSEATDSRYLEIINQLFKELNSSTNIEARRWVYLNLPENPEKGLHEMEDDSRDKVKRVLNSLDHVALLTQLNWVDEDMYMPWISPMVVKTWGKLAPYVDYESQRRNEPDYYKAARKLATRCQIWRASHYPGAKTIWVDDAL
jgi:hypothetical protein